MKVALREAVWKCHACGAPVADGAGVVFTSRRAAMDVLEAQEVWEATHPDAVDILELDTYPDAAPWIALHSSCISEELGDEFYIDVERIRTVEHLLQWSMLLLGKTWLLGTSWQMVVEKQMENLGISPLWD